MTYALIIIALILAALRIAGVTHEAYQAVAHLFVGGLFAAGWVQGFGAHDYDEERRAMWKFGIALALTAVEVWCFVAFRVMGHQ